MDIKKDDKMDKIITLVFCVICGAGLLVVLQAFDVALQIAGK